MHAAKTTDRAARLFSEAAPYLQDLLEHAPRFGSAGITLVFHEGALTRVDVAASVQRRTGGRP